MLAPISKRCSSQLAARAGLAGKFRILIASLQTAMQFCARPNFRVLVTARLAAQAGLAYLFVPKRTHRPKPVRLSFDCDNLKLELQLHRHLQLPRGTRIAGGETCA